MRILHVFRSPVGGLFRHVADLARGQRALGHDVGIVCDSQTGGAPAEAALQNLTSVCSLGISRFPISTLPGFGDLAATRIIAGRALAVTADVIHGHGAKGGVFGRLAARQLNIRSVYTPHGGSLHYDWLRPPGAFFLAAERALRFKNSGLIFVCQYERAVYARKIGLGTGPNAVIHNGLWPEEFETRTLQASATDLLFVGEMRKLKGVDILLDAIAALPEGQRPSLTLVGEGRDQHQFQQQAITRGLDGTCRFVGRKSMAEAKAMGRVLVLPSRHESFPYVVLEAVGAQVPVIASAIGGIAEILPPQCLVPVADVAALSAKLATVKAAEFQSNELAAQLQGQARKKFGVAKMSAAVADFYTTLR